MNSKMVTVNGKTYQVSCIDGQQFIKAMPSGAHITSEKTRAKVLAALAAASSRARWNEENPGELSLATFDDDA
jgi:hypothetical protein